MKNLLKKSLVVLAPVALVSRAFAVDAAIPTAADMTTSVTAIGGLAGAAAVLGLSIWVYRKTKAKGGQALG